MKLQHILRESKIILTKIYTSVRRIHIKIYLDVLKCKTIRIIGSQNFSEDLKHFTIQLLKWSWSLITATLKGRKCDSLKKLGRTLFPSM